MQVPCLVRMTRQALEDGKCVVIGLQSTGEARTVDVVAERGEELDDFVSGPRVSSRAHKTCTKPSFRLYSTFYTSELSPPCQFASHSHASASSHSFSVRYLPPFLVQDNWLWQ